MIKILKRKYFHHLNVPLHKVDKDQAIEQKEVRTAVVRKLYQDTATSPGALAAYPSNRLNNAIWALLKRCFDIAFSAMVLFAILSWLVPLIAILIKLESKGPVFFKQMRTGRHNRPFLCYKFRSLRINNDPHKQVTVDDARVTRIGKFLRKSSIDELPQFFNVLLGHMSIVGPRPHMVEHNREFSTRIINYESRHLVKPGITGLAQIKGFRGQISHNHQLEKRVEHDMKYISDWNFLLDVKIIFLTVYNVINGDANAY